MIASKKHGSEHLDAPPRAASWGATPLITRISTTISPWATQIPPAFRLFPAHCC